MKPVPRAAAVGGLGDASVTPVVRRPKTRSVMAGGRGVLGIRRLDVIDPNRPRDAPLALVVAVDSGVRACVHVWQPLTTRPHTIVDDQRFSLPTSSRRWVGSGVFTTTGLHHPPATSISWGNIVGRIRPRCWQMARHVRARVPYARPPSTAAADDGKPNSSGSQTIER